MAATVDMDLCTGCGACVEACPVDAITISDGKAHIDANECVECGVCQDECPTDAISVAESMASPPPGTQVTALPSLISRSSGAPTPETSCTVVPLPSLKV